MENTFLAGFGRRSLVPETSVPMSGYGNSFKRMSTNVLDPLFATCIALTESGQTLLLFTLDMISTNRDWVALVREKLTELTAIPGDHIMVCSTHTHSAPDLCSPLPCIEEYKALYINALVEAALEALEDRAPAKALGARSIAEDLVHVRHYVTANGTYAGSNFGSFKNNPAVGHIGEKDPELLLMKLEREEKPSILLTNFQVHPTCTSTGNPITTDISADFIGVVRKNVEATTKMHFAYFTGSAGNQVIISMVPAERDFQKFQECRTFGRGSNAVFGFKVAERIYEALTRLEPVEGTGFANVQVQFEQPINHEGEDKLEDAKRVAQYFKDTDRDTANVLALECGFTSVYHANAIISRTTRPLSDTLELNAFHVGPLSFATLPFESFGAQGKYIKEHSPFPMTMVFSLANSVKGYMPTKEAFDIGCYESFLCHFVPGTGEAVAEKAVSMLKSLQ